MREFPKVLLLTLVSVVAGCVLVNAAAEPPPWAYPVNPPGLEDSPDDGTLRRLPGSSAAYTLSQVRSFYSTPDWYPGDHPPMPEIVARGREPEVRACGFCHFANGFGKPENSSLAGLPAAYIVQQMADYKSGARQSSVPTLGPQRLMVGDGMAATDEDVRAAAKYFSSIEYTKWIRVVETDTVPEMHVRGWMLVPVEGGGTEPIGQRIVETAEDLDRTLLRDPRSGLVAYVPVGSIERGEALVATGGDGRTVQCAVCHGPDQRGLGVVPGLAGRSASYTVRQLYDFQSGARNGLWADLMREAVVNLTVEEMVAIAAYTASLSP